MRTGSLDSSRLLKFYVVAVVAGATAALALASVHPEWDNSDKFLNGFIAILAVGLAAEISSVRLHVGSSILSIAFIPFLAATFLFPPVWAMILGGITVFSVECLVRKKPWIKVVFNTSKEILAIGLAASVFQFLGGEPSVYAFPKVPFAFVAASVTYAATNSMTVSFAVSLAEGLDFYEAWSRMYGGAVLYDLFATPIPAFLAYLYVHNDLTGVVALTVPLFVVRHVYAQNLRLEQSNREMQQHPDRKSTRLNSSHLVISYAVFCLKKKKQHQNPVSTWLGASLRPLAHPPSGLGRPDSRRGLNRVDALVPAQVSLCAHL